MSINSDEPSVSKETALGMNSLPPTPTASISSMKSPSTNINREYSLIPMQKNLLQQNTDHSVDINLLSKPYFHDQRFSHVQNNTVHNSNMGGLPYNIQRLLSANNQQYYRGPSDFMATNILPLPYNPILPGINTDTSSLSNSTDVTNARKSREKFVGKSIPEQMQTEEGSLPSKPLTAVISAGKERRQKNSTKKDILTRKQLRRLTRRSRLAVLKFMMRKRKQKEQERISTHVIPALASEQPAPEMASISMVNSVKMDPCLPDVIASSLKISFDSTQKIESIYLYYHRRRQPDIIPEQSAITATKSENKLSLLLEAVELLETLNSNATHTQHSDK